MPKIRTFSFFNIILFITVLLSSESQAQGWYGNSPYSAFGVGEFFTQGNSHQQATGGAGVAAGNGIYINSLNPALIAMNRNTGYEIGLTGQLKNMSDATKTQKDVGGNLNYLTLVFPVKKYWSLSVGVRPQSSVDFEVRQSGQTLGSLNSDVIYSRKGNGSLSRAFVSNGFLIGKSLYVGAETNFFFGNVLRESTSRLLLGDGQDYELSLSDRQVFSGTSIKLGASWRQKLNKDWFLNIGGTFEPQNNIGVRRLKSYQTSIVTIDGATAITNPDTLTNYAKGNIRLPTQTRIGFTLEKPYKLYLSVDYLTQDWTKYLSFDKTPENAFRKSNTVAVGLDYMPNVSGTGYLNKIFYRLGFNSTVTPYSVNNNAVKDKSVTFGLGLPMGRSISYTNLSFALGKRGGTTNGMVQENYLRATLGFTLNDQWFTKFKID